MTTLTAGLNRNKATLWKRLLVRRQIAPNLNAGELVVIEAGAAQAGVVQLEPKGLDQMQSAAGVRTESDDVTGIGWDLRLAQNKMQETVGHGALTLYCASPPQYPPW